MHWLWLVDRRPHRTAEHGPAVCVSSLQWSAVPKQQLDGTELRAIRRPLKGIEACAIAASRRDARPIRYSAVSTVPRKHAHDSAQRAPSDVGRSAPACTIV
jgi:hypothetical protein